MDGHQGRAAQQAAHLHGVAHVRALHGDDADGGGLAVDHAHGGLVGDDGGDRLRRGTAGNGDHVQTHRAHAGHSLQLVDGQGAVQGRGDHALVLGDGDKGAGQAAHMAAGHDAALLHGVVQQGQGGGGAVGAADGQAHLLQDASHTVAHRRGGGQGQVHDAEGHVQTGAGLGGHHLAHAGDLEGGLFDSLGHHVEGLALAALQGVVHHAGAGHAHVDDGVGLTHAVEGAGHEGVVLHGVAEHHQLGAAQAVAVAGQVGRLLDDAAHLGHGVHVDAGLGAAHVDAGADQLRACQRLGNGGDEPPVAGGKALLHQGGVAADEVDAAGLGGAVQRQGQGDEVLAFAGRAGDGDGRDGDALVDDGDAELALDIAAGLDQLFGAGADLVVDLVAAAAHVLVGAVQQGDAHGDGADVQVLLVHHGDGVEDILQTQHIPHLLQLVHGVEDVLPLDADGQAAALAVGLQVGAQGVEGRLTLGQVHHHHHGEVALHDGLADIQDVDAAGRQGVAHTGDDAHLVLTHNGNDRFHNYILLSDGFCFGVGDAVCYSSSSNVSE